MKKILQIILILFIVVTTTAQTQGTLDTSFLPDNDGKKGANNAIFDAVEQTDGKIIIGGYFSEYNRIEKNRLVRINPDGSMDEAFNQTFLSSSGNEGVRALAIQSDGKILAVGDFEIFNSGSVVAGDIIRLNADGTRDLSFLQNATNFSCSDINSISIQNNGKIILAGDITFCFGDTLDNNENILRLNADGTIDQSFVAVIDETGLPGTAEIYKTIIQPDGKILVSGYFNESNGVSSPYLTRLNPDGSNDTSFNIGTGFDDDVRDIALQSDGKIIAVGEFDNFNGLGVNKIARLNADGSLDTSFNAGAGPQNEFSPGSFSSADALGVSIQPDGKIIVSGGFNAFNNVQVPQVARLNIDGSLDITFNNSLEGSPLFLTASNTNILNDGSVLVTGDFDRFANYVRENIVKLDSSGNIDFSFNALQGPSDGLTNALVNAIVPNQNGQYFIGGRFKEYDSDLRQNIARINSDGSLDQNFSTGSGPENGFDDDVKDIAVQNDGKALIVGEFDNYNGQSAGKIARLNTDGSLDTSFNSGSGFNNPADEIIIQPDGEILVLGSVITSYDGTTIDRIARLNPDGTLDNSFNANIPLSTPDALALDTNGKIYIGDSQALIRLNTDGSEDTSFSFPGASGFSLAFVNDIHISDTHIYVAGRFVENSSTDNKIIYKLNLDGSIDSTFTTPNVNFEALSIAIQSDGKILLSGEIENVSDSSISLSRNIRGLIRLNADGTFDDTFNPDQFTNEPEGIDVEASFYGDIRALFLENDGRLLAGGNFSSYNKQSKLSLIAVQAFNDVQSFINIPDPNFEQALIDLGIDTDGIINGQMAEDDALGVIDLNVDSKNISDLTGIEFFTDLETLSAVNNNLSTINLSQNTNLISALLALNNLSSIDFSNNPNLISISLNDNNLSSLDLSNNTVLTQVFVNNNNLSSIDVSMLSNLENLGVAGNSLTDLDISQNTSLFTLFCSDNQLQSLNVQNGNNTNFDNLEAQNNPNLTCIQVDDIAYSNTNWLNNGPAFNFDAQMFLSLDCTDFILIPDPNFEQALIDAGIDSDGIVNGQINGNDPQGITSLLLSSYDVSDLTGLEAFTDLEVLFADANNNLDNIDISQNIALENLTLNSCNLTSLDVSNNSNLTDLELSNNQINSFIFSNNTPLEKLYIQDNFLTEIDLSTLSSLQEINISGNNLTELDLSQNNALTRIICANNNLISLNVQNGNNTAIINNDFDASGNPNLTCIQVDDVAYSTNSWTIIDAQSFFSVDCTDFILIPDPNFEQALIDGGIDSDGIINGQINGNDPQGITSLLLSSYDVSDLTGLETFTDLEVLFADANNNLDNIDISQNTALVNLTLNSCNLTSLDVSNNSNLTDLELSNNQINSFIFSNNTPLEKLYIQNNFLNEIDLSTLSSLQDLNISGNNLTELDLSQNNALTRIICANNNLISLNVQNGNNTAIINNDFDATQNEYLTCITVDDVAYSTNSWTIIDTQSFFSLGCLPDNDDCSFAIPIVIGNTTSGTTNSSTPSGVDPNCQQSGVVIFDTWYEFVAPTSGSISLSIDATPLTARAAIYENCNDQTPIVCATNQIQVDNLNAGQTYYAQVWLEAGGSSLLSNTDNTAAGDFTILVEETLSNIGFEEQLKFSFYPNPAQDHITVSSTENIQSVQIFNINGKAVLSDNELNSTETSIDLSHLSQGTYLLKVDAEGSSSTQKLIIK